MIEIRLAMPADAGDLSRLHGASFEDGWSKDDFVTWLSRKESVAAVAHSEREAVAFGLALAAGDDAELLSIAVAPDRRGQGLGQGILAALDAEAHNHRLVRWVLEAARNNLPALALYKSAGFVEIGVRKDYYLTSEGKVDALMMSRAVGGPGGHQGS